VHGRTRGLGVTVGRVPGSTLYDALGVTPTASAAELRRAYLERARTLHPDRNIDAGPAARATAERKMQELTAAWQVLGDERRRRRYDRDNGIGIGEPVSSRERNEQLRQFVFRDDGTIEEDVAPLDGAARLIRGIPWIALFAVLVIIFIFSAYALTGGPKGGDLGGGNKTGQCVTVGRDGSVADASCDDDGARDIIGLVGPSSPCPAGTERFQPTSGSAVYCLQG
jgi:hypothetical protein